MREKLPVSFLLAAALGGLTLRLLFGLGYWTNQVPTRDEREYLAVARSLVEGRGFSGEPGSDAFGRAPGYPLFLAAVGGGRPSQSSTVPVPDSVKIAQAVVGAAGVFLAGLVAWRVSGVRGAKAAAVIAACYPPLVWVAAYGWSEALFWPMGLATVWLYDRAVDVDGSPARALATGAVAAASMLVRPAMIVFVALAAAWLALRRRLSTAVLLVVGAAVVLAPWTLRNYREYGRFVLVATEGGVTFWTGNHPLARGEGDLAVNPEMQMEKRALRERHPGLSEEAMEPVYYAEAFRWMREHPIDVITLEFKKLFYLIVPVGPSYTSRSTRYYVASVASYMLLLPVALWGVVRLGRSRGHTPGLWLLLGSAVAVCLVFFPQERFRIPIINPVLVVCAGAAFGAGREGALS